MSVNKQLEMVQKATFMDMFEYDAGISVTDDDNLELAGALFRGIFQSDENVDSETVLLLADWVREEVWNMLTHPKEDFYRGWITWSPSLGETKEGTTSAFTSGQTVSTKSIDSYVVAWSSMGYR